MSARAAWQLEYLGFGQVSHYLRGKADWMARGLKMEPRPAAAERLRALPYFVNNLAPAAREAWIGLSGRATVGKWAIDEPMRLGPDDPLAHCEHAGPPPCAVVLNAGGFLLGAIADGEAGARACDAMNSAPQTIRPDMAHRLARKLLERNPYLLVTTAMGKYLGRYRHGTAR